MSLLLSVVGDVLSFIEDVPEDLRENTIPGSTAFYSAGEYARILVQKITLKRSVIWHFMVIAQKNVTISFTTPTPLLLLCISLKGSLNFLFPGLGNKTIGEHQFNLFASDHAKSNLLFRKGDLSKFLVISVPDSNVEQYTSYFGQLEQLKLKQQKGKVNALNPFSLWYGPQVSKIIGEMLLGDYDLKYQDLYLDIRLQVVFYELLHRSAEADLSIAIPVNKAQLQLAKDLIDAALPERLPNIEIMRRTSLSAEQLMNGFKRTYGSTILQYVLERNIQKAALLFEQGRPIKEVMQVLGYKSQSSFLRIFISKTGKRPKDFKIA